MNFVICEISKASCVVMMPSRYVVTFSPLMDTKEDPQAIIIWDILTGQKKRGFHCESSAHWPIFKSVPCFVFYLLSFSKCPFTSVLFSNVFVPAVIEYDIMGHIFFSGGVMMGSSLPG